MSAQQAERHTLSQEDIDMLQNRRALDAEFKEFMQQSLEDRKGIRKEVDGLRAEVAANTRTTNEIHTALFAKNDDNDLGITGLVVSMQRVVNHSEVVCNFAKFAKRLVVGAGSLAGALAAIAAVGQLLGWWG
jgi:hypothetical protein